MVRMSRLVVPGYPHHITQRGTRRMKTFFGKKDSIHSVMDEDYLMATVRYVELNPFRAKLCRDLSEWPWSSYHCHVSGMFRLNQC